MPSSRRLDFVRTRVPALLLCAALLFPLAAAPAMAAGRTALVIGNSAYPTAPLKNPVNDATDMAAALKRLGFDVTLLTDATMRQMEEAVRAFGLKLRGGGIGLFYFAGHGVQVAGENYLVPVNAAIQSEGDVKYGSLNAGLVLAKMEDAGNGPNVVILDACRNNPFARSFRSAEAGLARMDAPTGSIVAYSTAPNSVASDGKGVNGLYTKYLLQNIGTQGITIEEVFKRVRIGVMGETGKKQVPWESSSISGYFYLAGGTPSAGQYGAAQAAGQATAAQTIVRQRQQDKKLQEYIAGLESEKRQVEQQKAELARMRQQLDVEAAQRLQQQQAPQEERLQNQIAVLEAERHKLEQERLELAKARQKAEAAMLQAQQAQAAAKAAATGAPQVASADPKAPLPKPRPRGEDRASILAKLSGVWRFDTDASLAIPNLSLKPGGDTLYGTLQGEDRLLRRVELTGLAMEGTTIHVRMSMHPAVRFTIGAPSVNGLARGQTNRVFECSGDVNSGDGDSFPVICERVDSGAQSGAQQRKVSGRMVRQSAARDW